MDSGGLLHIIVGGLLAVGGGALTQWRLNTQKFDYDIKKIKSVKYEELVQAIYEQDNIVSTARNIVLFNTKAEKVSNQIAKIQAIIHIYFPEVTDELDQYKTSIDLSLRSTASMVLPKGKTKENERSFVKHYLAYETARDNFLEELKKVSSKLN